MMHGQYFGHQIMQLKVALPTAAIQHVHMTFNPSYEYAVTGYN